MRAPSRRGLAAVAVAALLAALAPAHAAPAQENWFVLEAVLPAGATTLRFAGWLDTPGTEPIIIGSTWEWGWGFVSEFPGGAVRLRSSIPGAELELTPGPEGDSIEFVSQVRGLREGATYSFLVFIADMPVTDRIFSVRTEHGPIPFQVHAGSGARSVRVAEPGEGEGAGLEARRVAIGVGAGTVHRAEPDGIVGGMTFTCLAGPCVRGWDGPDGRSHLLVGASAYLTGYGVSSGTSRFVGPPGEWSWTWAGASSTVSVAAYAPVGDLWERFDHAS